MKEFRYVINDPLGLHARPAGLLAKEAKKYQSKITLTKDDKSATATQLLAIMGMAAKKGATVLVSIEGQDEEAAYLAIHKFFQENL
ncbi:MAG: phosphocarrier protein HPr [Clostridiales bacterium]|nr:phosphocarrier protein HPr [Clostridiales bacterium]